MARTSAPDYGARDTLPAMTDPPAAPPPPTIRISCVCLGNICRSPMAAAILTDCADAAGARVVVESAGTAAWHVGGPAHPETRTELARNGIASEHVARSFAAEDLRRLDLVLAMDRRNRADLISLAPGPTEAGKIRLIRAFDPLAPPGAEVPDPYGQGPEAYREVFRLLDAACRGLLGHIARCGPPPWSGRVPPA
jgi:protein-tyrosine phosphatase